MLMHDRLPRHALWPVGPFCAFYRRYDHVPFAANVARAAKQRRRLPARARSPHGEEVAGARHARPPHRAGDDLARVGAVRVPGGDVPDLGQQALRQRGGREPEREEVVVADGEVVLLRLDPRVRQERDLTAGGVGDQLGEVNDPVRLTRVWTRAASRLCVARTLLSTVYRLVTGERMEYGAATRTRISDPRCSANNASIPCPVFNRLR
jgi:hypothetical protein